MEKSFNHSFSFIEYAKICPDEMINEDDFIEKGLIKSYNQINNPEKKEYKKGYEKRLKAFIQMKRITYPDFNFEKFIKEHGLN
ncbi:hypothetical protein [Methanobrevibacter sp. DSM 116169]|uniref:hypothetical protein n=1 Tax=Methanobrevibacter sp. DSM 116169 TaxID=3242727 RepID=UPI0038FCA79D